jgi:hypothetical protein
MPARPARRVRAWLKASGTSATCGRCSYCTLKRSPEISNTQALVDASRAPSYLDPGSALRGSGSASRIPCLAYGICAATSSISTETRRPMPPSTGGLIEFSVSSP